ncbi:lysozyme family protein [Emticicia fontis]
MEDFEIKYEVENAQSYLAKGQSPIQVRRALIESGIEKEMATKISKEAYIRFLQSNARTKIIRGSIWFGAGLATSIILFQIGNKFSYLVIVGAIWGLIQVLSGISNIKSTKELSNNLFI